MMISSFGNVWHASTIPESISRGSSLPVDSTLQSPSRSLMRHLPHIPFPPHEETRYTPCLFNACCQKNMHRKRLVYEAIRFSQEEFLIFCKASTALLLEGSNFIAFSKAVVALRLKPSPR